MNDFETMYISRIVDLISYLDEILHDPSYPWERPLGWVETQTGVQRIKISTGLMMIISYYLMHGCGVVTTGHLICYAYSVHVTFAPMNITTGSFTHESRMDVAKWCKFWMTLAAILIVEKHLWFLVYSVPYYTLFKTVFLIWCAVSIENDCTAYVHKIFGRYFPERSKPANSPLFIET